MSKAQGIDPGSVERYRDQNWARVKIVVNVTLLWPDDCSYILIFGSAKLKHNNSNITEGSADCSSMWALLWIFWCPGHSDKSLWVANGSIMRHMVSKSEYLTQHNSPWNAIIAYTMPCNCKFMPEDGTCGFQGTFLFLGLFRQTAKVLRKPYSDHSIEINSIPFSRIYFWGVSKKTSRVPRVSYSVISGWLPLVDVVFCENLLQWVCAIST